MVNCLVQLISTCSNCARVAYNCFFFFFFFFQIFFFLITRVHIHFNMGRVWWKFSKGKARNVAESKLDRVTGGFCGILLNRLITAGSGGTAPLSIK